MKTATRLGAMLCAAALWPNPAFAQLTARITSPADGSTNADLAQPIQWTSVAGAQAYQLYVGSTPGGMDILNSRQVQTTSFAATNVPANRTVYARIWVQVGGVWRYTDSSFSGSQLTTRIVYPASGSMNADVAQPVQWSAVPNAQAYQLHLGSTPGGNDWLDSFQIQTTSYAWGAVPTNQDVYARIWVQVGGVWRFTDSSFRSVRLATQMTYPASSATDADLSRPIQWLAVPNAQAYELYLGSSPGGRDILDSHQMQDASFLVTNVPANQTVYARIWTEVGNVWRYADSVFATAPSSRFTYPPNGATNVDLGVPLQWTTVPGAQAYQLYVGTSIGAYDLVNSQQIQQTSYFAPLLPVGQTLYARIWSEMGSVWRSTDISFTAAPIARFTNPTSGATNVNLGRALQWTAVLGAQAYQLYVGTSVGARDLLNSMQIQQTSYFAPLLPLGQPLYARIWTQAGGAWRFADITFTAGLSTFTISGSIRPPSQSAGATVALTGALSRTATADAAGNYSFTGLANGTYTVTPTVTGDSLVRSSWTGTVANAHISGVNFITEGPTKDRANSYDSGWKTEWVTHARAVLGSAVKTDGFVLQIGDSITHAAGYALWPLRGQGKTSEDSDIITWARGTSWTTSNNDVVNRNGWYLASADTTSQRGMTASGGLAINELLSGCCNGGTTMPATMGASVAALTVADPAYSGNLQLDTVLAAFNDAQFAVVMLGTNYTGSLTAIADLGAIVDKLEAQHIVPILSTIPPRIDMNANQLTIQFNAAVTSFARARQLPLIGFYEEILLRRPGNSWMRTLIVDGVHPSSTGGGYSAESDPYVPGGDPATHTTGDATLNVGYLLRSWLTIQKLKDVKLNVIDQAGRPD